jgi:predicted secreted protein
MAWAKGAKFSATIDAVLTEIADLTSITAPSFSRDEIDISSHDSVDNYREYVGGMIDAGTVEIEGIFKAHTSQLALKDLLETDDPVAMQIETASGKTITFNGFVTAFDLELPFEDAEGFSASIKVTGKPTIA